MKKRRGYIIAAVVAAVFLGVVGVRQYMNYLAQPLDEVEVTDSAEVDNIVRKYGRDCRAGAEPFRHPPQARLVADRSASADGKDEGRVRRAQDKGRTGVCGLLHKGQHPAKSVFRLRRKPEVVHRFRFAQRLSSDPRRESRDVGT